MALITQPPSMNNAVTREMQLHDMRVRAIQENQMRLEQNRVTASSYRYHYEVSNAGKEGKRSGSISHSSWNDQEAKRKRRLAKYKLYEAEGKARSSFKEGLRTFKLACRKLIPNNECKFKEQSARLHHTWEQKRGTREG
ncbi:unnamed protein product [Sphenostylis stenocarpa]|uniref:Uncharacterized protein n=1 Tax=Sphenostylis stenocarpa TaxID=92480 RepID=A0AA86VUH0_9FABA|nr:unnamed protein product [Sphenostylis stenocarpa]